MIKLKKYVHYRNRSKGREYHYIMTHGLYHVQPFQLSMNSLRQMKYRKEFHEVFKHGYTIVWRKSALHLLT